MGQWGVIAIALVSLALVVLQNDSVIVPLVVLGRSLPALPLGWWMAGAIALGWLTMSWLLLLARAGRGGAGRSRRPEPWQRRDDPPSPVPPRRVARALDDERADHERADYERTDRELADRELADRELTDRELADRGLADERADRAQTPTRDGRSAQRGWQDAPEDLADPTTEFDQVVGDWDEPNRQDAGWRDDAAWDEWQMPEPARRPRRDRRSTTASSTTASSATASNDSSSTMDAQLEARSDLFSDGRFSDAQSSDGRSGDGRSGDGRSGDGRSDPQRQPSPRDRTAFQPDPEPKIFEAPQTPIKQSQVGSIYSYRYRDDDDPDERSDTAPTTEPAPDSPTADQHGRDHEAPRVILVPGATGETPLDTVVDPPVETPKTIQNENPSTTTSRAPDDSSHSARFSTPERSTNDPPTNTPPTNTPPTNTPPTNTPTTNTPTTPDAAPTRQESASPPTPLDLPAAWPAPPSQDVQPAPPLNLPTPTASDRRPLNLTPPSETRPPLTLGDHTPDRPTDRPTDHALDRPTHDPTSDDEWDDLGDLDADSELNLGPDPDTDFDGLGSLRSRLRRDRQAASRPFSAAEPAAADETDPPDLSKRVRSWFQGKRRNSAQDKDNRWEPTPDPTGDDWDDWAANPRPTPPEWEDDR